MSALSELLSKIDWVQFITLGGLIVALVKAFYESPAEKAESKAAIAKKYQDMLSAAADQLKASRMELSEARDEIRVLRDDLDRFRKERDEEVAALTERVNTVERKLAHHQDGTGILLSQLDENGLVPKWSPEVGE